jgi:hypothetical protein
MVFNNQMSTSTENQENRGKIDFESSGSTLNQMEVSRLNVNFEQSWSIIVLSSDEYMVQ